MNMWVTCRLLNASFIFNGIEYAKLHLCLCFYEFDLYAGRRFWTLFSPKSTLRLIRESTCTRVYTVLREDLRRMFRWSQDWKLLFNLKSAQLCTWERETKSYHMKWEVRY